MSRYGVLAATAVASLLIASAAAAAVTAEFFDGALSAESDAADPIAVTCIGGTAKVNGADPEGDPAPCASVESIDIRGGPGTNAIDLSDVTAASFPAATSVLAAGDDGDDTITGGALVDELEGQDGDDTVRGNAGNDALGGGAGSDRLVGGAGDDTLVADLGSDALDGQAGSDTYRLDLFESGPTIRVADTGTEGTDTIELEDCGNVTIRAGEILLEGTAVTLSGIETYPCGFVPPPPPPTAAKDACVVPRLRGRSLAKAKVLLARAHCSLGKVTRVRSRVKRGVVLRQSPAPRVRKARGAKVALRVSRGP